MGENPYESPQAKEPKPAGVRPAESAGERTPLELRVRLAAMMFLQYFVQGAFLPVVSLYLQTTLKFGPAELGYFNAAMALGPLVAPFFVGQLVDRRFATQHVLAAFHFLAGGLMLVLWTQRGFWLVMILGTVFSILYVPTMMISNTLAFAHLKDRNRDFPIVRLFGTIGFIIPAWLIEPLWLSRFSGEALDQQRGIVLLFAGVAGILMAVYSMTLPSTPPSSTESREFAPLAAARLLKQRNFLVLVLATFIIGAVHQYFFTWNSPFLKSLLTDAKIDAAYEQRISSIGQIAEIVVMAFLGSMLVGLGFKRTMLVGALAYMTRCLILSGAAALSGPFAARMGLACLGQALHGVCFGCFLAVAFIYVDRESPKDVRGSAQTLYGTLVLGIGFFLGGLIGGWVGKFFSAAKLVTVYELVEGKPSPLPKEIVVQDYAMIWLSGAAIAAAGLLLLAMLFPSDRTETAVKS
jgi:nucleoside transporter